MSTTDDLSKLLEAERKAAVPGAALERGWQRLTHDLAGNVAPLPVASGAIKLGLAVFPKWLLAGFALGLVGAGASAPLFAPHLASNTAPARVAKTAPVVSARASKAETTEPPAVIPPNPSPRAPEPPHASALPSASASTTFDAELDLISHAKSELDAHRPQQARIWLAQHEQRFPHGVFVVEREALSVLVSCEQVPQNQGLVRHVAAQHPGSPLVERLERACSAATVAEKPPLPASVDFSKSLNGSPGPGERTAEPNAGEQP